jgi:hypothetical protein
MTKRRNQATASRVEQLAEQYLAATNTVTEANSLDELAKAVNESAKSALTAAIIERLTHKYRAAATAVARGNRLDQLAGVADETGNSALKWWVLEAAEASTDEADEHLRIRALEVFQWLQYPSDRYRQRVIRWVLRRIEQAGRRSSERVYAITAARLWIHKPRVRAHLLRLVNDETEGEDVRILALGCFSRFPRGEAPAEVVKTCERLSGDTGLVPTAAYVLRQVR